MRIIHKMIYIGRFMTLHIPGCLCKPNVFSCSRSYQWKNVTCVKCLKKGKKKMK